MSLENRHINIYILIASILIVSYVLCGTLLLTLQDFHLLRPHVDSETRILVIAYLWGVVGGTSYCSLYFAREANAHREGRLAPLPNRLEPFGYVLFLFLSGFTGTLLLAMIHAGFISAYKPAKLDEISEFALAVIAFVGGLTAERVRHFCAMISESMMREGKVSEKEKNPNKAKAGS